MKSLVFSPRAEADIDQIYDYTADRWGFDQAEAYTLELRDTCKILADGRRQGRSLDKLRHGYLALACGSHFIIYRETKHEIVIVRILHQRMNVRRHL